MFAAIAACAMGGAANAAARTLELEDANERLARLVAENPEAPRARLWRQLLRFHELHDVALERFGISDALDVGAGGGLALARDSLDQI